MGKIYKKPVMLVERFVPNEYVAACGDGNPDDIEKYIFQCDVQNPAGNLLVVNHPKHGWIPVYGYDACQAEHQVVLTDTFVDGFIDLNGNMAQDKDELSVKVWLEEHETMRASTEYHATTITDMSKWEKVKS